MNDNDMPPLPEAADYIATLHDGGAVCDVPHWTAEQMLAYGKACAQAAREARAPEVRLNEDKSLDEVVGRGDFHLEQMDSNVWWLRIDNSVGAVAVWLRSKGKIKAHYEVEVIRARKP